jgi:hypothetical protein
VFKATLSRQGLVFELWEPEEVGEECSVASNSDKVSEEEEGRDAERERR